MKKSCQYCGSEYYIRPSRYEESKFCSRICHDKGKTYSDGRKRVSKEKVVAIRLKERLSVRDIADRLNISYSTVARHVKAHPLTEKERRQINADKQKRKRWGDCKSKVSRKRFLIEERGYRCERCEIEKWQGKRIVMELNHIDGDTGNNRKDNLELLCPNCHSQTPTWCGRNKKRLGM